MRTQSIITVVIHHKRSNGGMPKARGQTATDDNQTNLGADDDDDTCFSHNHHNQQHPCSVTYAYTTHGQLAEKSFPLALSNTVTLDHSFKRPWCTHSNVHASHIYIYIYTYIYIYIYIKIKIYVLGAGPTCPTGKEGAKRPPQFDKPKGVKQPILPAKQIRGWAPSAPHTHWCASNNPPSCNPLPCLRQVSQRPLPCLRQVSQRTVQAYAHSPCPQRYHVYH